MDVRNAKCLVNVIDPSLDDLIEVIFKLFCLDEHLCVSLELEQVFLSNTKELLDRQVAHDLGQLVKEVEHKDRPPYL